MSEVNGSAVLDVVAEAQILLEQFQFEQCADLLQKYVQKDGKNFQVWELLGQAYQELGQSELAIKAFQQSTQIAPEATGETWLSLAQLHSGFDALKLYEQAINVLKKHQAAAKDKVEAEAIAKQISTALCSMAELYETDLCDEPEAESECTRLLTQAVGVCARNPEAFYAWVNLRLIQQKKDDATKYLERTLQLMKESDDVSYELKTNVAKACLEMGQLEAATELFDDLLEEDDEMIETWYWAAIANLQADDRETAALYAHRVNFMLQASPDKEMQKSLQALAKQIGGPVMAAAQEEAAKLYALRAESDMMDTQAASSAASSSNPFSGMSAAATVGNGVGTHSASNGSSSRRRSSSRGRASKKESAPAPMQTGDDDAMDADEDDAGDAMMKDA